MLMIIILLILLSKIQTYMFLLSVITLSANQNYQNFLAKDLKDRFFGMNINQKVKMKMQQMNLDCLF